MRGTIYIMCDEKAMRKGYYHAPYDDYELMGMIPGCDGIEESDLEEEALPDLRETYSLQNIPTKKMELDGLQQKVGILEESHMAALKQALTRSIDERIKKIKKELQKPKPSLWFVAEEAYNYSLSYFLITTSGLLNEVDMRDTIDDLSAPIYILGAYSYHY